MEQLNKYEQIFEETLDIMEFQVIKHKTQTEEEDGFFSLIDLQGGNLGNIENERFTDAEDIAERLGNYIEDYFVSSIQNILAEDFKDETFDFGTGSWDDLIKYVREKYPTQINQFGGEIDFLDTLANHMDKVDINKIAVNAEEE